MKSSTDIYWSERAKSVESDVEVNIMDVFQRNLEYEYVYRYLSKEMRLLEVGCGNGFSTVRFRTRVAHVDAFDYAESMVERARRTHGETNNRFVHDDLLTLRKIGGPYDAVVCIRVLINLRSLEEQKTALANLGRMLGPGGRLVLVEGFRDGFEAINALRQRVGLPPVEAAAINFYSWLEDVVPTIERYWEIEARFHLGMYDYLTRVVYPLMVGPERVRHNTVFSERCEALARAENPDAFEKFSRVRGFVGRRRR